MFDFLFCCCCVFTFCPLTHYLWQNFANPFAMIIYLVYLTFCRICDWLQGYKDTNLASLSILIDVHFDEYLSCPLTDACCVFPVHRRWRLRSGSTWKRRPTRPRQTRSCPSRNSTTPWSWTRPPTWGSAVPISPYRPRHAPRPRPCDHTP